MSNRERGVFEGAIHHVWQRGNNKDFIFKDNNVKYFLIKQLKEYNKKFDYKLLGYVIMDNHYHLLMQTFKDPIGEVMFNINNVSGKFIKENLERTGHVFQGRYNSKLVQTNEYFLWLLRYMHRNPVRAKMCPNVGDYFWSSHRFYVRGYSNFINVDFPLSMFSPDRKEASMLYLKLMNADGSEESSKKDFEFFEQKLKQYTRMNTNKDFKLPVRTSIEGIVNSLNLQPEEIHLLTSGCRKRCLTNIKIAIAKRALAEKYTTTEIASYLNIKQPSLSKLINTHH